MSLQTSMEHGVLVVLRFILKSAEWLQTQPYAKGATLLRYHARFVWARAKSKQSFAASVGRDKPPFCTTNADREQSASD